MVDRPGGRMWWLHLVVVSAVLSTTLALPTQLSDQSSVKREISQSKPNANLNEPQEITAPVSLGVQEPESQSPKKVVTYILGTSTKESIKSPADLLRPDRYEFYTFDDDGKIIKKLMDIEEIQKILASSRDSAAQTETKPSNDFYQVLTVTPDVESLPVKKVNPNEPLFSIHDVIASVQKVLKAEIKDRVTETPTLVVDGFQNAHLVPEGETLPPLKSTTPPKLANLQLEEKTGSNEIVSESEIETLDEKIEDAPEMSLTEIIIQKTSTAVPTPAATTAAPSTTEKAVPPATVTLKSITTTTPTPSTTKLPPATTRAPTTTTKKATPHTTTKKPVTTTKKAPTKKPEPVKSTTKTRPAATTTPRPTTTVKITTTTSAPPSRATVPTTIASTTTQKTVPTRNVVRTTSSTSTATTTTTTTTTQAPITTPKQRPTTTAAPVQEITLRTMQEILAELKNNNMTASSEDDPTMVEVLRVTSSVSQSSSPSSQIPPVTTLRPTPATDIPSADTATTIRYLPEQEATTYSAEDNTEEPETQTEAETITESQKEDTTDEPLSLLDAHPGFTSVGESSSNGTESVFALENNLFDILPGYNITGSKANYTLAESALNSVQIPMNEDLAESVSSVLSQIADEISMNALNFEGREVTTLQPETREGDDLFITTEASLTTQFPESWLKNAEDIMLIEEGNTEVPTTFETPTTTINPTTERQSFKPQNRPRPFSKPTTTETPTSTVSEDVTTTFSPEMELRTEADVTLSPDNDLTTITTPTQEETTTETVENISATVQPEKESDLANRLEVIESNGNSSSIEIIQEAETGRIPRPTQNPGEITTRPGSTIITTASPVQSTNKGSDAQYSTSTSSPTSANLPPSTNSIPSETLTPLNLLSSTETSVNGLSTNELKIEATSESVKVTPTSESNIVSPTETIEINPDDEVENISISFLPMFIRSSTQPPQPPTQQTTTSEPILPPSNELLESKVVPEEIVEKSALSHGAAIAAISEEKAAPPKQYVRPQTYVKPQKPVFIKPTKGNKPQPLIDAKPSKPVRPSSDEDQRPYEAPLLSAPASLELDQAPAENLGLEATTVHLETDVREFVELCNELAFSLWSSITHNGLSFVRSVVVSPFAVTSMLAMVFLGARGPTSGQMNDVLKLDDVVTFNPHLVFRNVTESLVIARHPGVATAAFVRELYSDRSKGKLLDFYKERAQQFYDGHVEEVNFKAVGENLRRQTNHLVRRQTWGKVRDFLQGSTLLLRPPLAAFSANIFQADCSRASIKDRDGEMYFVVLPSNRLRRLVPIPAAVWRDDFLAGYEPNLDATAASVGSVGGIVSTIFVMPGKQGMIAPGDSLARLEHHLLGSSYRRGHWDRLLRSLLRRPGLELQVPRINHKSVVNVTASLVKMGLRDLFSSEKADLTGLNGLANDLHLSDMVQVNQFSTCGDEPSGSQSHSEYYPASPLQRSADLYGDSIDSLFAVSDFDDPSISALPLELRPRQARLPSGRSEARVPDTPRLRLDRPFLFFVRHNPTGFILHVGRFNPRLMH